MRKFFWGLIFLLILGGLAFFFGWAQFTVPPGSYGVVRSKTHGVDLQVVREGEFRWIWYKLIPTNVTVTVFSPSSINKPVQMSGMLPQAESYRSFLGLTADFSYEISGSLSFSVKAGSLPDLVRDQGINSQEDLERFEQKLAADVLILLNQSLRTYAEKGDTLRQILETGSVEGLLEDVYRAYPDLENLSCGITTLKMPDFELYESARSLYEEYLRRQHDLLTGEVRDSAGRHLASQMRFEELARYGELLTRYPILLQYLALEKGKAIEYPKDQD